MNKDREPCNRENKQQALKTISLYLVLKMIWNSIRVAKIEINLVTDKYLIYGAHTHTIPSRQLRHWFSKVSFRFVPRSPQYKFLLFISYLFLLLRTTSNRILILCACKGWLEEIRARANPMGLWRMCCILRSMLYVYANSRAVSFILS